MNLCVDLMIKDIYCTKCDLSLSRTNRIAVRTLPSPRNSLKKIETLLIKILWKPVYSRFLHVLRVIAFYPFTKK